MGIETGEKQNKKGTLNFLKGVAERSMDLFWAIKTQIEHINRKNDPYRTTHRQLKKLEEILEKRQEIESVDSIISCLYRIEDSYTDEVFECNNTFSSSRSVIEKKSEKLKYLSMMQDRVLSLIEQAEKLSNLENIDDRESLFQELKEFYTENCKFYKELDTSWES